MDRRSPLTLLLLVAALLLALWPWLLSPGELPFSRSSELLQHLALKELVRESFTTGGRLPAWNSHTLLGHPIPGDPSYGLYYPPAVLFLLTTPARIFTPFLVLHVLLGALAAHALLRRHRLSAEASALGALSYGLNLRLVSVLFAGVLPAAAAWAWVPVAFLGLELLRQRHRGSQELQGVLLMGASLAMQALAGAPELMIFTMLFLLGYALIMPILPAEPTAVVPEPPPPPGRALVALETLAACGLALLLALPLLYPAIRLLGESTRATGLAFTAALFDSIPPIHALSFFFPALSGSPMDDSWRGPGQFWETSFYPGLLVWILALLALLRFRNEPRALPLTVLAYVALVLAFGHHGPLAPFLFYLVPGFDRLFAPGSFFPLLGLLIALLAALELDALGARDAHDLRRRTRLTVAVVALLCVMAGAWLLTHETALLPELEARVRGRQPGVDAGQASFDGLLLGFGIAAALCLALERALVSSPLLAARGQGFRMLVLSLVGLELVYMSQHHLTTRPESTLRAAHPLAEVLQKETRGEWLQAPRRILDLSGALSDEVAMRYGLELVTGTNPLVMSRPYTFARFIQSEPASVPDDRPVEGITVYAIHHPRLLDLLRVGELVTESPAPVPGFRLQSEPIRDISVSRRLQATRTFPVLYRHSRQVPLPAAWVVPRAGALPALAEEALTRLDSLDPFQGALLDDPTGRQPLPPGPLTDGMLPERTLETFATATTVIDPTRVARIEAWRADAMTLSVDVPGNGGVLVLSEPYAPGWTVEVDGRTEHVWRANYLLRAVVLPPGNHRVVWRFVP